MEKKGLEIREEIFGKDSPEIGEFYDEMSRVHLSAGNYKQSLQFCQKALKIKEKNNKDYSEMIKIYARMMKNYYYLHELDKGINFGLGILNDTRIREGQVSEDVIQIIRLLAFMYSFQGNKEEMWKWIEEGIDKAVKYFGENSVQAAEMYVEKAAEMTDKDEKLKLLKTALEIYLTRVGMRDNRAGRAYRYIWKCWEGEAEQPVEMGLKWLEKNISHEHFTQVQKWVMRR